MISVGISSGISRRYAHALFSLGIEKNKSGEYLNELEQIREILKKMRN